ncbi:hypothetical protein HHK36_031241 [Tetracentron sinense]|uniref:Methyltransferase type 11 domain-containing protein n=1 Tax=Tetracentron sinense TaxID=13715 RepID=A0A834YAW6_TETSI|nr:hypothetical protein HHK36_031241 [Tetracentron sinense]
MGSVSLNIGDGTARFRRASVCSSALNILMLFSVLTTNLFALYAFTSSPTNHPVHHTHKNISLISEQVSLILREIDSSQSKLAQMEKDLLGYENIDLSTPNIVNELKLFLQHHPLPLGKDSRTGITEMVASVGHSCAKSMDVLSQFMNYKVGGACPDDWSLAQKLILRGCEPLPRRRCFAKSIPKVGLFHFPLSLWKPVSDKIVSWSGLGCKNFECLNSRKVARDCDSCFDLVNGFEKQRFVKARSKNDFLVDDVLSLGSGGIRIGFDIGGGSGSFAARMAERNVTVITSTLNVEAPFSEFIAARGLFPLFMSLDQRFPFYDNVFDLVHTANGLGDEGRPEKIEFLMFDIDRILRAGGLFWLDNFYCADEERKRTLTRLIERFGYKKLKWVVGEKVDATGAGKSQVYLSAVLQKPPQVDEDKSDCGSFSKCRSIKLVKKRPSYRRRLKSVCHICGSFGADSPIELLLILADEDEAPFGLNVYTTADRGSIMEHKEHVAYPAGYAADMLESPVLVFTSFNSDCFKPNSLECNKNYRSSFRFAGEDCSGVVDQLRDHT